MTGHDDPRGPLPDADQLDELASALVDGEVDADERARASAPAVAERVAAFEAVARRVGEPIPPPAEADRERAILAALAAADEGDGPVAQGRVVALGSRPGRRLPRWLPAAAAVAVVAGGFGLLVAVVGDGDDRQDTAAEVPTAAADAGDGDGDGAADRSDAALEEGAAEAPPVASQEADTFGEGAGGSAAAPDLGAFDDLAGLEAALGGLATRTESEGGADAAGGDVPCAEAAEPGAVLSTAVLDDRPVTVALTTGPGDRSSYVVLDQDSCEQLATGTV